MNNPIQKPMVLFPNCRKTFKFLRFDIIFFDGYKFYKNKSFAKTNLYLHCSLTLFCMEYLMGVKSAWGSNLCPCSNLSPERIVLRPSFFCLNVLTTIHFKKMQKKICTVSMNFDDNSIFWRDPQKSGGPQFLKICSN